MDEVADKCPIYCRHHQLELLSSLLGKDDSVALPRLFLYGHTATGKSATIKFVLQKMILLRLKQQYNNCGLDKSSTCGTKFTSSELRCDNANDFVRLLRQSFSVNKLGRKCVYIILEHAERLRDMEAGLLPAFLSLHELSELNVGVILESEIVWEKFQVGTGFPDPYVVHFPNYSKDELLEILSQYAPKSCKVEAYRVYINLLLSVFHVVCRDLSELLHLAAINYSIYMEPVTKGEASLEDTHKLWRHLEPHLKKALQTVYLHEVSGAKWEQMHQQGAPQPSTGLSSRTNLELPVYSKYLLIAAYIASYNPPKSDRRFFSKNAGKLSKRAKTSKQKNERKCCQLLGPKAFPLSRFMAIFYSVVGVSVPSTTNVQSQITSLVTLGLLAQVNVTDLISTPKYVCLVSLDFIKSIARSVNFEVTQYLWDLI